MKEIDGIYPIFMAAPNAAPQMRSVFIAENENPPPHGDIPCGGDDKFSAGCGVSFFNTSIR